MTDPVPRPVTDDSASDVRGVARMRVAPADGGGADADLVGRVRAGDRAALTAIFRELYGGLCEFATRYVRSDALAEELVQDVFAAIWSNRGAWVVKGTVRSYLYGAVRNRALRSTARAALAAGWAERVTRDAEEMPRVAAGADVEYEATELAAAVARVLDALPARRREAYVLRREHGLSTADAAAVMGISRKAVEMHVMRALQALRAELGSLVARPSEGRGGRDGGA